jgi:putative FmdB family regulatory protein
MPLYEYSCTGCHASEERLGSFSSPPDHDCPICGKHGGMKRQLSVPSISFSGGGWYAQGYGERPPCKEGKPAPDDSSKAADGGRCESCPHKKQPQQKNN